MLDNQPVLHRGTLRQGSWKMMKGLFLTFHKLIPDSPIQEMSRKSTSNILDTCEWRYIRKNPRTTIMSPCDKMLVIELSGANDIFYIQFWCIFHCTMVCNENEWQKQLQWINCDWTTMIHQNLSPCDKILSMVILNIQIDISDQQPPNSQYTRQYLCHKVILYLWYQQRWRKLLVSANIPLW